MLDGQEAKRFPVALKTDTLTIMHIHASLELSRFDIRWQLGISASCPFRIKFTSNFFGLVFFLVQQFQQQFRSCYAVCKFF